MLRVFVALASLLVAAACPGSLPPPECECFPCSTAVQLTVVDGEDGTALNNFEIELILNGEARGTPAGCFSEDRTGNFCEFGSETGVYHMVVTAPGYATREARLRQPERGTGDLCCRACLSARVLTVELDPL